MTRCPPIDHILHDLHWCQTSRPIAGDPPCDYRSAGIDTAWRVEALWQSRSSHRLGHYFEMLWQALLETDRSRQLLACDLQLNHAKKTLGALDFLLFNPNRAQYTHLEVAVKFYLLNGDATDPMAWIGPNAKDRLGRKLHHLAHHQTQLLQSDPGRDAVNAILTRESLPLLHPGNLQVRQMIQGWLFIGAEDKSKICLGDDRHRGCWYRFSEWAMAANTLPEKLIWLPRHYWISGAHTIPKETLHTHSPLPESPATLEAGSMPGWLNTHPYPHQFQLSTLSQSRRIFLVPDHWPGQADFCDTPSRKI